MLKPSTLVGSELKPPVGPAKDWMWNGDTVVHSLMRLLGPDGERPKPWHALEGPEFSPSPPKRFLAARIGICGTARTHMAIEP